MAEGTQTLQWGQPWLCSAEPHVEAPEAPGNFQTQQNHSKEKRGKAQKKDTPPLFPPPPWFLGPTLQVEFALSALQKDRTHRVQIVVAVTAQGASPSFCYLQRM